jgi:hypothetical protein
MNAPANVIQLPTPDGNEWMLSEKEKPVRLRGLAIAMAASLSLFVAVAACAMWAVLAQQQTLMEPPRRILPAETPTPIVTPATPLAYAKEEPYANEKIFSAFELSPPATPVPTPAPIIHQPHRWLHQVHRRHREPAYEDAETRQLNRQQIR